MKIFAQSFDRLSFLIDNDKKFLEGVKIFLMNVGKERLADFIGQKKIFTIPVYQRNYDWRQDNCEQLFFDIKQIIEKNRPHFLGTFVYQQKHSADIFQELIIIDGQQRITSILLFIKAIYDLSTDEDIRDEIKKSFLERLKHSPTHLFKLKPIEFDRSVFETLMTYDNFDENNFSETDKLNNIYKNYLMFKDLISKSNLDVKNFYNSIYNLEIVKILLDNENPQEIFESLNSTGRDLSNTDLIRNYLLMPLPDLQEELYKNYWLKIEQLIQPKNMETFLVQYLITKRRSNSVNENGKSGSLNSKNLYRSFKEYFQEQYKTDENAIPVEEFLKDLYRYAGFYKKFLFDEGTVFSNLSALDKKFYELVYMLDTKNAPIILMYLYDRYDKNNFNEETFIKFTDALISWSFRSKICNKSGINAQSAGNAIQRLDQHQLDDDSLSNFWDAIAFGKDSAAIPDDEEFKIELITKKLYRNRKNDGCKYLLYTLELNSENAKELPDYNNDNISIEHIMPQKLNDDWKKYLDSKNELRLHEQFLNTLGNLALTGYNGEMKNYSFERKKEIYSKSSYSCTRDLISYNEWTSKQIQLRAEKLANLALKIWTLPEKYNAVLTTSEKPFNFDSDASIFRGKQLDIVSISGMNKKIVYWSNFLVEIVKKLYDYDKNTFQRAISMNNVPSHNSLILTNPNESEKFKRPISLDENYYICTNFGADTIFKISKALIENFDAIKNTNFKAEIWFTLKK